MTDYRDNGGYHPDDTITIKPQGQGYIIETLEQIEPVTQTSVLQTTRCQNQALVDLFVNMDARYRELWLNHPVAHIEEIFSETRKQIEPDAICIVFTNKMVVQYASREIVCEVVGALQECSDFKPSMVLDAYVLEHRRIKHIKLTSIIKKNGAEHILLTDDKSITVKDMDLLVSGHYPGDLKIDSSGNIDKKCLCNMNDVQVGLSKNLLDKAVRDLESFSAAPFKVIQDYIYACSFLSPYVPRFVDLANDLLAYRLSYAISQEKEIDATQAIAHLAKDINDYAIKSDRNCNLRAFASVPLFQGTKFPSLTITSDFGRIIVEHQPELTSVDWENLYKQLRQRHA